MLRFVTAGESHGSCLTAILEGIPAGLPLSCADINSDLARRQISYGRGQRMEIEKDEVTITSGVRLGKTLGSPVTLVIENRDWINWQEKMSVSPVKNLKYQAIAEPRPGHADLSGALKYDHRDMRNVLERSSARETAARVAAGSVCRAFLRCFGIEIYSFVTEIGGIRIKKNGTPLKALFKEAEKSPLRCSCKDAEKKIRKIIDAAKKRGDSLGGVFEVIAEGAPPGLGSHTQYDLRLDGRMAQAIMSIQAIKGVEVGLGFDAARLVGSRVHDEIFYNKGKGFYRKTNNAGGIEGGMTNGEPIVVRGAMKPIATLYAPLQSVDIVSKKPVRAAVERSDICRVPSAAVIGEAMVCIELTRAFLEKFGGDSMQETSRNYKSYLQYLKKF